MKRSLLPVLIAPMLLAGCATGYATDWFRNEAGIIRPQLLRYGLDVEQSRCVSEALGGSLAHQQLRPFQERAAAMPTPAAGTQALAQLRAAAGGGRVGEALEAAIGSCNVQMAAAASTNTAPVATGETGSAPVTMSGNIPVDATPVAPAGAAATWLNLGSAESGQSIGIDARSIQQEGNVRIAWFRMTDPESGANTNNMYRLRIDCQARTIQPLALRQTDAAGAEISNREYTPAEAVPGPAETGTVLEIAFISMCT